MQHVACTSGAMLYGVYMPIAPSDRDQRKSDHLDPQELVEMFRQAGRRGPCPTPAMLAECPFIRSMTWVREMMAFVPEWEPAEREAKSALRILSDTLPEILDAYRKLI